MGKGVGVPHALSPLRRQKEKPMPINFCRFIKTDGRRCQSPAMRDKSHCYFHGQSKLRHRALLRPDASTIIRSHDLDTSHLDQNPLVAEYYGLVKGPLLLDFPALEDRESIQLSLSMILTALGQDRIDLKRATGMLYNLQIASANAGNLKPNVDSTVTETVLDESGNELAPDEIPAEILDRYALIEAIEEDERRAEENDDEED
jgi:hypothetical protein